MGGHLTAREEKSATSREMQQQICACTAAASSCLTTRALPRTTLNTGTAHQGLVPLVHPLSLLPKTPPGTTHLQQPRALSLALTNNSFFHLQGKNPSCPSAQPRSACRQLVGRARGRQDRPVLGPSVCPSVRPSCGSPAPGVDVSAPGSRAVGGRHRSYCIKNNTAEHKFITDKCDSQEELTSPSLSA